MLKTGKALDIIDKLRVVEFDWKHDNSHEVGMIAEEVEQVFPGAVAKIGEQTYGLKLLPLIALLVKAIQELKE